MKIITEQQRAQLLLNGSRENREKDHFPVVKLFVPGTGCTWLLTEIDPDCPDLAFGLCDLGMGFPELGYVDLEEISTVKNRFGLCVEADFYFKAKFPLSVYTQAAYAHEHIVEVEPILNRFVPKPSL